MKKYSGHKLYKFPAGHTLRSECEYPYKPAMKGGHTYNHIRNVHKRMRKCHVCGESSLNGKWVL